MSAATEHVFIEALSLPTRERASLVRRLLVSLESETGSPEIDAAWKQEALERCAAFDEGKITERDADSLTTTNRVERRADIKEAHGEGKGPGPIESKK